MWLIWNFTISKLRFVNCYFKLSHISLKSKPWPLDSLILSREKSCVTLKWRKVPEKGFVLLPYMSCTQIENFILFHLMTLLFFLRFKKKNNFTFLIRKSITSQFYLSVTNNGQNTFFLSIMCIVKHPVLFSKFFKQNTHPVIVMENQILIWNK